jgi:diguanylate cyclase (GGDEF)-like protein
MRSMPSALDPALLPEIDAALAHIGWMPSVPRDLVPSFRASGEASRRTNNRYVILMLTLMFDLYWLPQHQFAPDIVHISGILRFAVFTPAALLFCALKIPKSVYDLYLLALALGASFITIFLCLHTMEMVSQPEIYGTPLILLYSGVLLRLPLPVLAANISITTAAYITGILVCPMLSRTDTGTFAFVQVAVALAVLAFNIQLETRNRQVFLLTFNERIRRSLVAEQNSGLLRETQTDPLTQLANRRCFDETLSHEWLRALAAGNPLCLIMIDIDHFKAFNDRYGHVMGDDCLRKVGAVLRAETRPSNLVARYGGEEFAVILTDTLSDAAVAVAHRLREAVQHQKIPHEGAGPGAIVTISVGLASICPTKGENGRLLIEEADRALYAAKHAGRNCVSALPMVDPGHVF